MSPCVFLTVFFFFKSIKWTLLNSVWLFPAARLAGGSNSSEGRFEIKIGDEWGTVCDAGFDQIDANVVCNQLGFGSAMSIVSDVGRFGTATGPVLIKDVDCNSNFQLMFQCTSSSVVDGDEDCTHANDVGVVCSTTSKTQPNAALMHSLSVFPFTVLRWNGIIYAYWTCYFVVVGGGGGAPRALPPPPPPRARNYLFNSSTAG